MTNDLEKTFFDTFGIEPITQAVWDSTETKWKNFESWEEYPQITDRILLELICIWNDNCTYSEDWLIPSNMKKLKEATFYKFLTYKDCNVSSCQRRIYNQVQALFEEG